MFQLLAVIAYRYPKTIILGWVLFMLFFSYSAPKLPQVLHDHGLAPDGAFAKVEQQLASDFRIPKDPVILVFEKKAAVTPQTFRRYIQQALNRLQGMEGLNSAISPLDHDDMFKGNFAYALLSFQQEPHQMEAVLEHVRKKLPSHSDAKIGITGKSAVQADVNRASQSDLFKAERIGVPAAFVILLLAFGGIRSALIPIVAGMIGVTGTMGMMYGLGTAIELSNFVLNVIPMVGFALSIDFALMIVSRFREQLQRYSAKQALVTTMMTAGRAVFFSGLCVCLGLIGVLFIPLPMFSSIALGAATVLAVSLLIALTFVPALLAVMWPAIIEERQVSFLPEKGNKWMLLSRYVLKRPIRHGLAATFLLIVCFLPLGQMSVGIPDAASLPPSYAARITFENYQAQFVPPNRTEVYVLAFGKADKVGNDDRLEAMKLIKHLKGDPLVVDVSDRPAVSDLKMLIRVTLHGDPSSAEVRDWLREWERAGETSSLTYLLGGEAKYQQEVYDDVFDNLSDVLLFLFVSNYIVLFLAFRSILIPLKTIVMNFLSMGAAFGILSWIFQEGHFGMEPSSIAIMIPVFIFGLAFGISMDYGVFLISRIYEEYERTQDNDRAVLAGMSSISRIINCAAAIIIVVTVPFAFGDVVGVKQLGIGIAAAIFIDATIIRMLLVPSLMKLLGQWNWWAPRWLRK
ncbi:MMPL family transporter [Paenibacillus harenae]|uniref:RND superfamily putative drug exporter n=1 Tax=Paenibacillus harenae TaxID=306543 RepID=A0ABT9TXQ8_PAEHA|nr:efflux RND transporter permease subunit [Paenibacillus harenae]MDQ0111250.1 RND superfamily putative drug exporter [Paenibacillus harenae]